MRKDKEKLNRGLCFFYILLEGNKNKHTKLSICTIALHYLSISEQNLKEHIIIVR